MANTPQPLWNKRLESIPIFLSLVVEFIEKWVKKGWKIIKFFTKRLYNIIYGKQNHH
jgi:hypothetical protein